MTDSSISKLSQNISVGFLLFHAKLQVEQYILSPLTVQKKTKLTKF